MKNIMQEIWNEKELDRRGGIYVASCMFLQRLFSSSLPPSFLLPFFSFSLDGMDEIALVTLIFVLFYFTPLHNTPTPCIYSRLNYGYALDDPDIFFFFLLLLLPRHPSFAVFPVFSIHPSSIGLSPLKLSLPLSDSYFFLPTLSNTIPILCATKPSPCRCLCVCVLPKRRTQQTSQTSDRNVWSGFFYSQWVYIQ